MNTIVLQWSYTLSTALTVTLAIDKDDGMIASAAYQQASMQRWEVCSAKSQSHFFERKKAGKWFEKYV
jgi:hypothetical protein